MAIHKKLASAGAAIALAASGLVFSTAVMADDAKDAKVHCAGINSCKGQTACKSANNDCKGQNSCKGQGWAPTATEQECTDQGGTVS